MILPSSARHGWDPDEGGDVEYLDLGDAIVTVPGGVAKLRRGLLAAISDDDWALARAGFRDSELVNE
jgi:hypothetical protein